MARQVLPTIDFRTQAQRQGVTRTQQNAQAIASILQTVGLAEQKRRQSQTLDRITRAISGGATTVEAITAAAEQGPEFATGFRGGLQKFAGGFQPGGDQIKQLIVGQALKQALVGPLESEYKRAQIESTKALTTQREAAAEQALPNRMLRQADRYLRVVDDVMSEYWYTPEGPYRDKLLKDAQRAREKAMKLIEKYGVDSEAGKASLQQLDKLDEEIKKAGGKVEPPALPEKIKFSAEQTKRIEAIYEKARSKGINRLDLWREISKLKGLDLTQEEIITAYDKIAEGATAEQLIEFLRSK